MFGPRPQVAGGYVTVRGAIYRAKPPSPVRVCPSNDNLTNSLTVDRVSGRQVSIGNVTVERASRVDILNLVSSVARVGVAIGSHISAVVKSCDESVISIATGQKLPVHQNMVIGVARE